MTLEQSHEIARTGLQHREDNLLEAVRRNIYENESSPYLGLLRLAGCEYGDFERMVRSDGVEQTLRELCRVGVYVTLEEFKGTQEIRRSGKSFKVSESDFDSPSLSKVLSDSSGATRSSGTRNSYDFDVLSDYAVHRSLMLESAGVLDIPFAMWWPILPGGGPKQLLTFTKAGKVPVKWFSQVGKRGSGSRFRDRTATKLVVHAGRLFGTDWPLPEYTPLDRAVEVAEWMAKEAEKNGGCCLLTYPSSAVRVCQEAKANGLDMSATTFMIAGEPFTRAKKAEIESAHAAAAPFYASTETGVIGHGCPNPTSVGQVHLFSHSLALIQHRREVPHSGGSVDAFLLTTLSPSAPKVMFNTENGDHGLISRETCGCSLEKLGFDTRLSNIRGFDKLTAEGMTLFGGDMVKIVEEVLPACYGGNSTDYQIVEEEDESGQTRMSVLVSPAVGRVDEADLIRTVIASLPQSGITATIWNSAGTLRVKRTLPMATSRGKLMPLHVLKSK